MIVSTLNQKSEFELTEREREGGKEERLRRKERESELIHIIIIRSEDESHTHHRLAVKADYATGFSSGAEAMNSGAEETSKTIFTLQRSMTSIQKSTCTKNT